MTSRALQSAFLMAARLCGAALVLVTQALLARWWGADALGSYILIGAAINLLATIMPLGFQTVAGYFAADYAAHGKVARLHAFLRRAYGHVVALAAILIAGALAGRMLWPDVASSAIWLPVVVLAAIVALVFVNGAVLVGLKRPIAGFLADTLMRPLLMLFGFLIATATAAGPAFATLLWSAALGFSVIAVVQSIAVWHSICGIAPTADAAPPASEKRRWWRFAIPWR